MLDAVSGAPRWIVLEYAADGTLEQHVGRVCKAQGGLGLGDIVDVGVDILEGLAHLHALQPEGVVVRWVRWSAYLATLFWCEPVNQ